jgi:hypothetical protein
MSYARLPIVGMFYRPPAKVLVNVIAVGTPLKLLAEPDNPADPNAIAVWVKSSDIPESAHEALEEQLPEYGFCVADILNQDEWHLGYIPKNFAAELKSTGVVTDDKPVDVKFCTNPKGDPRVEFDEPVL